MMHIGRATSPAQLRGLEKLTFPAYRHLLSLEPAPRLLGEALQEPVLPVAVVAIADGSAVGLALADMPVRAAAGTAGEGELLSVSVVSDHRHQGVGTALLAAMERELAAAGLEAVHATYTTGPATPIVERMLARRGWRRPESRMLSVRCTADEAMSTPWYRAGHRLREGFELFPWRDLTGEERQELQDSQRRRPWIAEDLQPWDHDSYGFEPHTSLGIRYRGDVVGWVINHQIAPDTVRFTCSYLRKDLSRFGRIIPAYVESIRLLKASGFRWLTLTAPIHHRGMAGFVLKRCAPWVTRCAETRGTRLELSPVAEGASDSSSVATGSMGADFVGTGVEA